MQPGPEDLDIENLCRSPTRSRATGVCSARAHGVSRSWAPAPPPPARQEGQAKLREPLRSAKSGASRVGRTPLSARPYPTQGVAAVNLVYGRLVGPRKSARSILTPHASSMSRTCRLAPSEESASRTMATVVGSSVTPSSGATSIPASAAANAISDVHRGRLTKVSKRSAPATDPHVPVWRKLPRDAHRRRAATRRSTGLDRRPAAKRPPSSEATTSRSDTGPAPQSIPLPQQHVGQCSIQSRREQCGPAIPGHLTPACARYMGSDSHGPAARRCLPSTSGVLASRLSPLSPGTDMGSPSATVSLRRPGQDHPLEMMRQHS
jgi:hypothetical protein